MKFSLNQSVRKAFGVLTITLASIMIAGCSDDDSNNTLQRGALLGTDARPALQTVEEDTLQSWVDDFWKLLSNCSGEGVVFNAWELLFARQANFRTVAAVPLKYVSADIHGNKLELTGALLIPQTLVKKQFPLISIQHGTQLLRLLVPSVMAPKIANDIKAYSISDSFEVILGFLLARAGYIVALADYPGMGPQTDGNPGFHPYVHGRSLAISVVDMLRASRDYLKNNEGSLNVSWNGQLFLMGYSEGGYVTLATARELQQKHADEFTVTAVAPLDGPHDLTGVMLPVMEGTSLFPAPYFLPYVIKGYQTVYGAAYAPEAAFAATYDTTVPPLMDGSHSGHDISCAIAEIQGRSGTDCAAALRPILRSEFLAALNDTSSDAFKDLRSNDLYLEDLPGQCSYKNAQNACVWIPKAPVQFFHHPDDDLVPVGNSRNAFDQFKKAGAQHVGLQEFKCTVPVDNVIHVNAALPALLAGFGWLDAFYK